MVYPAETTGRKPAFGRCILDNLVFDAVSPFSRSVTPDTRTSNSVMSDGLRMVSHPLDVDAAIWVQAPPRRGISEIVRMPRVAPEPAAKHFAAVLWSGLEALEFIVAHDLEAEPNREQQYLPDHRPG